jgi:hypothetical protein
MTIREVLIPRLSERFSGHGLKVSEIEPFATFPAAHGAVGDVSIWDDGHEATIGLGTITHSHFDCSNTTLSDLERSEFIADEVMSFLGDLFEDRILIWRSPDKRSAGGRLGSRMRCRSWMRLTRHSCGPVPSRIHSKTSRGGGDDSSVACDGKPST